MHAQSQPEVCKDSAGVARAFDLAGITNTLGMVHAKIIKGGPPANERALMPSERLKSVKSDWHFSFGVPNFY